MFPLGISYLQEASAFISLAVTAGAKFPWIFLKIINKTNSFVCHLSTEQDNFCSH